MKLRYWIVGSLVAVHLAGCGTSRDHARRNFDSGSPKDDAGVCERATQCQRFEWGQLIVGVTSVDGVPLPELSLTALAPDSHGDLVDVGEGDTELCDVVEDLTDGTVVCRSQWHLSQGPITVQLTIEDQPTWKHTVDLAPFNYCGTDIRYLLVEVAQDKSVGVKRDELISPCHRLSD